MNQALKQNIVMVTTVAELTWLTFFLKDLHNPLSTPPIIYYDNRSAMYIMFNPVFHTRNKYIKLNYHFVREQVVLDFSLLNVYPLVIHLYLTYVKGCSQLL
jgi:hypothetical protein